MLSVSELSETEEQKSGMEAACIELLWAQF